ncbi:MAG: DNA repair protein RadA [Pseudomonadota bacterium]|nr:DNA repair protein RadA [Pseudomonadota bacterium]
MAKAKKAYVCVDCGAHSVKWQGQCPDCDAWNTLTETTVSTALPAPSRDMAEARAVGDLTEDSELRYPSGFDEFDRVLGGGIVPGSVVLLGGDPGVGKSTLLQQVATMLPVDLDVCYATGEESLRQVAQRSHRLGLDNPSLRLLADTSVDNVLEQARAMKSKALVIDSIQTMAAADVSSAPGSVSQLRECVSRIVTFAKQREVAVFLIGHITKEGTIAGPRAVEHMVDTVMYFENDPGSRYTIVRAVKNRFGASSEMGVFAMSESGFREVRNPSAIFLSRQDESGPGRIVTTAWEGSRPLLVEIQALVADSNSNYPRRLAQGVDQNRLAMIMALLQRHGGVPLSGEDIFVNVVGGLRIGETSADLPVALSVASSFRDRPCRERLISFGEIGLAGEVRPVRFGDERIREAAKQGFTLAIVSAANTPREKVDGIEVVGVKTLVAALEAAIT